MTVRRTVVAALCLTMVGVPLAAPTSTSRLPDLPTSKAWSATAADWSGDGRDDLLLVRHAHTTPDLLLRDVDGRFEVWWELPVVGRHDCAAIDADADGRMDIYCTVGAQAGLGQGDNELWIQQPDATFVDRAAQWGVLDPYGRGRYIAVLDVNQDGRDDLYIGNALRADGRSANRLAVNLGDRFVVLPAAVPAGASRCAASNGALVALCYHDRPSHVIATGDMSEVARSAPPGAHWIMAEPFEDGFALLTRTSVEVPGARLDLPRRGYDVAVGDFDGDGRDDLYVLSSGCFDATYHNPADMVYLNEAGGWRLAAQPRGPDGCGLVVTAVEGDSRDAVVVMQGGTTQMEGTIWMWELP